MSKMSAKQRQRIADLKERQSAVQDIVKSKKVTPEMKKRYKEAQDKVLDNVPGVAKDGTERWDRWADAQTKSERTATTQYTKGKRTAKRAKVDKAKTPWDG